jgi:hypothetical protein
MSSVPAVPHGHFVLRSFCNVLCPVSGLVLRSFCNVLCPRQRSSPSAVPTAMRFIGVALHVSGTARAVRCPAVRKNHDAVKSRTIFSTHRAACAAPLVWRMVWYWGRTRDSGFDF